MTSQFYRRAVASLVPGVMLGGMFCCMLGCSAVMKPVRVVGLAQKDLVLQIQIDPDANDATPIAVDVVTADNKKTVADITAMSATQWFARRTDVQRMKGKQVRVQSWEWVPGETIPDVHVAGTIGKDAVVLFARYSTKGEHRAVLPAVGKVQLQFKAEDFRMEAPGVPPAAPSVP